MWRSLFKPFAAWFAACCGASLILLLTYLVADQGVGHGLAKSDLRLIDIVLAMILLLPFVLVVTALPVMLLVFLARRHNWHRPQAELLAAFLLWFVLCVSIQFLGNSLSRRSDGAHVRSGGVGRWSNLLVYHWSIKTDL